MGMLWKAGIKIPAMYKMGYNNNNCIGCVKGGMGYWNKIRKDFPEVFAQMAQIERDVGATCLRIKTVVFSLMNYQYGEVTQWKRLYRIVLLSAKLNFKR